MGTLGNLREIISFSSYLKVFLTDFTTSILFSDHPTAAPVDQRLCSSFDTSGFFPTWRSYKYFPTSTELWAFDRRPPLYRSTTWYLFSDHTAWYLFLNWRTSLPWSINDSWPEFPPPPPPILTHALTWFPLPFPPFLPQQNQSPTFFDAISRPVSRSLPFSFHRIFFPFHCKTAQKFRTETYAPPLFLTQSLGCICANWFILEPHPSCVPCNTTEKEVNVLYLN